MSSLLSSAWPEAGSGPRVSLSPLTAPSGAGGESGGSPALTQLLRHGGQRPGPAAAPRPTPHLRGRLPRRLQALRSARQVRRRLARVTWRRVTRLSAPGGRLTQRNRAGAACARRLGPGGLRLYLGGREAGEEEHWPAGRQRQLAPGAAVSRPEEGLQPDLRLLCSTGLGLALPPVPVWMLLVYLGITS